MLIDRLEAAMWSDLIEFSNHFFLCVGPDGSFLYVNRACRKALGYSSDEIRSLKFWMVIDPSQSEDCQDLFHLIFDGHNVDRIRVKFVSRDNKVILTEGSCCCSYKNDRPAVMTGMFRDIEDKVEADRALLESEERLRILINSMPDLVIFKDVAGRWLEANNAALRLFDLEDTDYRGRTYGELLGNNDRFRNSFIPFCEQSDEETWLKGSPTRFEITLNDGSPFGRTCDLIKVPLYHPDGMPKGMVVIGRDITERKDAEERLRQISAERKTILDNITLGIGYSRERYIIWVNDALCKIFGYRPEELINKSTEIFYPTKEEFNVFGRKARKILSEGKAFTDERELRHKSGSLIWCRIIGKAVNPDDLDHGIIWIIEDITHIRKSVEERKKLEEQMQQAQKLESLGVLAGGIAHDFNNLLMGILGYADLALLKDPEESPLHRYLRQIKKAARTAADLTNQMLAYSGRGKFIIEPIHLSRLIDEMSYLLQTIVSKKAVIKYNLEENIPEIEADATQIRQILMNMVINASEAIGDRSGVITITTGAMEADKSYLAEAYLDEDLPSGYYSFLEVSDTGAGMDGDTISRVFDPFFTTKFSGRGLGLAAVLGIVRGHKGAIKVYSEPGQGTTFKVLFPCSKGLPRAVSNGNHDLKQTLRKKIKGKVLVVDDEETVRSVAKMMLEQAGIEVVTAVDGCEAVKIYRENVGDIEVVLLDMTMPHMNGEEAFRELRRINPGIKVILSSGYNEQEAVNRFAGKGLVGFIQKPYGMRELLEKVHKAASKCLTGQDEKCMHDKSV